MKDSVLFHYHIWTKTLVYNFGSEAGFFSEFNTLILAILYCYKYRVNFVLYDSSLQKFGLDCTEGLNHLGCKQSKNILHSKYNYRQAYAVPKNMRYKIKSYLFKLFSCFSYYTYELFPLFHNSSFEEEQFVINGNLYNLRQACCYVAKSIYVFHPDVQHSISEIVNSLNLPSEYVSVHIRRGDKSTETDFVPIDEYIKLLKAHYKGINSLFVATDDYDSKRSISRVGKPI